jgi:ribosomal-protein-alanine N-acetyltransferase
MIKSLSESDIEFAWELTRSGEFSESWTRSLLLQELKEGQSLGLWDDGVLKAFLLYRELPDQIEVSWLVTRSQDQGSGRMTKLILQLIAAHSQMSEIWLEVHEDNLRAQKLYEKLGFVLTGRRPRYYRNDRAALLYSKTL